MRRNIAPWRIQGGMEELATSFIDYQIGMDDSFHSTVIGAAVGLAINMNDDGFFLREVRPFIESEVGRGVVRGQWGKKQDLTFFYEVIDQLREIFEEECERSRELFIGPPAWSDEEVWTVR